MRAAYLSILDLPNRNAHAVQVMKNAQAWSKAVRDFEFVTNLGQKNWLRLNKKGLQDIYGLSHPFAIKAYPLQGGLRARRLPIPPGIFHWLAARRCVRRGVELVYTRANLTPSFTLAQGIPTVAEAHAPPGPEADKKALYASTRHAKFLALVTISQDLRRRYIEHGLPEEKILVEPDGVDLDAFAPALGKEEARARLGLDPRTPLAVYVGHLYEGRGVEYILAAAAEMEDTAFLLVGGHNEDITRWRGRAREAGLANLTFTGFVPNSQVPLYLWTADVLLMPYGSACPTAQWMSPLKMFEYMAAGRPIVASSLPAIAQVLRQGENALLSPPDQGPPLAAAIRRVLQNPEFARDMAHKAREEVAEYSWDARVGRILDFVKGCLS